MVPESPSNRSTEPARASATPRSPANQALGMKATLLFPSRDVVQEWYLPIVYTACRTCYSELEPDEIFRRAVDGHIATET